MLLKYILKCSRTYWLQITPVYKLLWKPAFNQSTDNKNSIVRLCTIQLTNYLFNARLWYEHACLHWVNVHACVCGKGRWVEWEKISWLPHERKNLHCRHPRLIKYICVAKHWVPVIGCSQCLADNFPPWLLPSRVVLVGAATAWILANFNRD